MEHYKAGLLRRKRRFTPACGPITAPLSDTAGSLLLRWEDGAGQIIGGCMPSGWGSWALLDACWVAESRRGTGLGPASWPSWSRTPPARGAKRLELNTPPWIPGPRLLA